MYVVLCLYYSLQWTSRDRLMPVVFWGKQSEGYDHMKTVSCIAKYFVNNCIFTPTLPSLQAQTVTYNASDMCGSPAIDWGWRDPGLLHHVTLDK